MATFVNREQNNDKEKSKESLKWLSLKEHNSVKYFFSDEDVDEIFDALIQTNALTISEPKIPEQINRTNNLKYCHYHKLPLIF